MEGVQQHLDDAFANKGHPDASPHFPPAAAALFANSSLAPPQSDAQASKQQTASEQGAAQPQQVPAQVSEDAVSLSSATPQMQDAAAPEAAAAPAAEHTAAELPAGPAQDAAAATAANGIPTAIVPTDNDVVVEAVTAPAAAPKDANAAEAAAPNGECDVPGGNQRWTTHQISCYRETIVFQHRCFPLQMLITWFWSTCIKWHEQQVGANASVQGKGLCSFAGQPEAIANGLPPAAPSEKQPYQAPKLSPTAQFQMEAALQKDAFLVFRALCKLSVRASETAAGTDMTAIRGKVSGLPIPSVVCIVKFSCQL